MKTLLPIVILCLAAPALAQPPDKLWSPQWEANLQAAHAAQHPFCREVVKYSDASGPDGSAPGEAVWDYLYAVMAQQSDPAKSAAKFREAIDQWKPLGEQLTFEGIGYARHTHDGPLYPLMLSRLESRMTEDERTKARASLIARANYCLDIRLDDSDMFQGHFQLIDGTDVVLGTSILPPAWRELQAKYLAAATGGQWFESTEYDQLTSVVGMVGSAAAGFDRNPGSKAWLDGLAEFHNWQVTDDGKERVQYGDCEHPHDLGIWYLYPNVLVAAGLSGNKQTAHLAAKLPMDVPRYFRFGGAWAMLCFNPLDLPEKSEWVPPVGVRQTPTGQLIFRKPGTLVQVICPLPVLQVDHQVNQWDVRWWERGDWLVDHPIGYMPWSRNYTGTEFYGLPQGGKVTLSQAELIDGGFQVSMATSGTPGIYWGWDKPITTIKSASRNLIFQNDVLDLEDKAELTTPVVPSGGYGQWQWDHRIDILGQFFHSQPGAAKPEAIDGGFRWLSRAGTQMYLATNATKREVVPAVYGENIGTYLHDGELGGNIIQLGGNHTIRTRIAPLKMPDAPPAPGADINPVDAGTVEPPPVEPPSPDEPPPVDPPPPVEPPPAGDVQILDKATLTGSWIDWTATGINGGLCYASPGENTATWTFTVKPGRYKVATTWPEYPNRATNAMYRVGALEVKVNQELAPASFEAGEVHWQTLGEVDATDKLTVVLDAAGADEFVIADAVRVERIGDVGPDDIPVKGVLRGKTLIIELPESKP